MNQSETRPDRERRASLVRPSRDGDQFHYLWAARRCLSLLSPEQGLVGVSIEGASPDEILPESADPAGDTVIDVAEYYGDTDPSRARRVRYTQLKHSSRHPQRVWTASGLQKTLKGFSAKYENLRHEFGAEDVTHRFEFRFVTNRPISLPIAQAVEDAAPGAAPRRAAPRHAIQANFKNSKRFTSLAGAELSAFCGLLHFEGRQDDYWDQRNILFSGGKRLFARCRR